MLSPLDIEMKEFKKNLGGYNKEDVDEFMRILLQDYKELYMENVSMKDKLGTLTTAVSRYKSMEDVMQNTLIVAQSTSDEVKKTANAKAQTIIEEAETKARELLMDSKHQLSQINMELEQMKMVMAGYKNQMRSILQSGLEMIEKIPEANPKVLPQAEPAPPQSAQAQTYHAAPQSAVDGVAENVAQQSYAPSAASFEPAESEEIRLRREETMLHIRQAMEQQMSVENIQEED
ncbi:MAG: DivIVA domain-containing protein [Clostridia bacterium]|nr:DivIVA domain-containing protein [Clostridia bacterium]